MSNKGSNEYALFRLRVGMCCFERPGDAAKFLEPFRPLIKTDELVRALLINRVFGGVDKDFRDFSADEREMLEVLLDELPDSEQLRYVLSYIAFQPLGIDGMSTLSAHRIMERRFSNDRWFRRQVEQYAGARGVGFSKSHFLEDLSWHDADLIQEWVGSDLKYVPMCFGMGGIQSAICYHPTFQLDEYEISEPLRKQLQELQRGKDLASRLRLLLASPDIQYSDKRRIGDEIAKHLDAESIEALCSVADDLKHSGRVTASIVLLRNISKSPRIAEWARAYEPPGDSAWWWQTQIWDADDPEVVQRALRRLLEQPIIQAYESGPFNGLNRLCKGKWKLAADEGVELFKSALANEGQKSRRTALLELLVEAYPDHPETRQLVIDGGCATALRRLEGVTPDVVKLAIASTTNSPAVLEGTAAILADSQSEEGFAILMRIAEKADNDWARGTAIRALANGYASRTGVKEFLFNTARNNSRASQIRPAALRSLAWHFQDDAETQEFLFELGTEAGYYDQASELFDYVCDPDYSGWVSNRAAWERRCRELMKSTGENARWERNRGAFGMALWFGDSEAALNLHIEATRDNHDESFLRNMVIRWPRNPRVLQAVQAALNSSILKMREEAACLLSRAYSEHPETRELLRKHIRESSIVLGEYLGLRMGELEAMREGLAILEDLPAGEAGKDLALDGPLQLLRYFGPRKDLYAALVNLGERTTNVDLLKGIGRGIGRFFPHRQWGLDSPLAEVRMEAPWKVVVEGGILAKVTDMSRNDPVDAVRLEAVRVLLRRAPNPESVLETAKDLVCRGVSGSIRVLGEMRPNDEETVRWLMKAFVSAPALSSNVSLRLELTGAVGGSFGKSQTGLEYLLERTDASENALELNTAIGGLCHRYGERPEVRAVLDKFLTDPRLRDSVVESLIAVKVAGMSPIQKADYCLSLMNDEKCSPKAQAAPVAAKIVAAMLSPRGGLYDTPDTKRVREALLQAAQHHANEEVRAGIIGKLQSVLYQSGENEEMRRQRQPEIVEAIRIWYQEEVKKRQAGCGVSA